MTLFIALLLAAALAYQAWVTLRVWRSEVYPRPQKAAQSKLIWLLPVLGAVIVHSVMAEEDRHERSATHRPPDRPQ